MKRLVLAVPPVDTPAEQPEPVPSQLNTGMFEEWFREAQDSARAIGRMPPGSPTLRSRVGAVLVRIVRRMLFWYTPQIVGFNTAVVSAIQEQNNLIKQLAEQIRGERVSRENDIRIVNESLSQSAAAQERLLLDIRAAAAAQERLLLDIRAAGAARENAERQAIERWQTSEAKIVQLRTMLFTLERRQTAIPVQESVSGTAEPATPPRLDAADNLYLMLEDRFRGSRADIKIRLREYLPYVVEKTAGNATLQVLDIGCGRGEWLELLRESRIAASGIDLNAAFVSYCDGLGLTVTLDDAVSNLRQRPGMSLDAITAFHVLEHLPWLKLVELIDETLRVLNPGGLAIFETPNPTNVLVGSCNFYLDPTHRNPLPPLLLQFLLDARGFSGVEVLPLHPYSDTARIPSDGSVIADRFNDHFYGPQDYGIIARKL